MKNFGGLSTTIFIKHQSFLKILVPHNAADSKHRNPKAKHKNQELIRDNMGYKNAKPQGYQHTANQLWHTDGSSFRLHFQTTFACLVYNIPKPKMRYDKNVKIYEENYAKMLYFI